MSSQILDDPLRRTKMRPNGATTGRGFPLTLEAAGGCVTRETPAGPALVGVEMAGGGVHIHRRGNMSLDDAGRHRSHAV